LIFLPTSPQKQKRKYKNKLPGKKNWCWRSLDFVLVLKQKYEMETSRHNERSCRFFWKIVEFPPLFFGKTFLFEFSKKRRIVFFTTDLLFFFHFFFCLFFY
jgi:hypothetical protein